MLSLIYCCYCHAPVYYRKCGFFFRNRNGANEPRAILIARAVFCKGFIDEVVLWWLLWIDSAGGAWAEMGGVDGSDQAVFDGCRKPAQWGRNHLRREIPGADLTFVTRAKSSTTFGCTASRSIFTSTVSAHLLGRVARHQDLIHWPVLLAILTTHPNQQRHISTVSLAHHGLHHRLRTCPVYNPVNALLTFT